MNRHSVPGRGRRTRESGNAVLISILLLSFLAALAAAQFTVVHKNAQSSSFFLTHSELHNYAECGIDLAIHDLTYKLSGKDGNIGTEQWNPAHDNGRDGRAGTLDEGEGDGIPTPGEQHVNLVPIGSANQAAGLMVWASDTGFANIKRVVATASSPATGIMATVDTFVLRTLPQVPRLGAVYVDPDVVLDLKGNSFLLDGNDHALDGTVLPTGSMPAISTEIGDPPGSNQVNLLSQIDASSYDQVIGAGGTPSIGETSDMTLDSIFEAFQEVETQEVAPGTHESPLMGTLDQLQITHVSGDLHLTGEGSGAGILVIDGSVTFTGEFTFYGLVIVRGDVRASGGGAKIHVLGSLMIGDSFTAIDPLTAEDVTISGNADVFYCSEMLARLSELFDERYAVVYYDDK